MEFQTLVIQRGVGPEISFSSVAFTAASGAETMNKFADKTSLHVFSALASFSYPCPYIYVSRVLKETFPCAR